MLTVTDNPEAQRYEGRVGGALAGTVDYYLRPGLITVVHTEVREAFARGASARCWSPGCSTTSAPAG